MLVPSVLFSDNGIPGCELLCTKLLFVCTFTSTVDYCLLFFLLVNHVSMLSQIVFLKNVMLQKKKKKRLMISNIMHLMNKPCLPVWSGKTHIHDYCNMFQVFRCKNHSEDTTGSPVFMFGHELEFLMTTT